jgi:UDP-N-acetylglucosamine 2-epimerase (non-hydrolysing)
MKIMSIVGARPQFIKLKPVDDHLTRVGLEHIVVHTGQHYDQNLSEIFFKNLNIPQPDLNLRIGSSPHGAQIGKMLEKLEPYLLKVKPDWVLVFGDTNSTLAGALCAAKSNIPIAHIEAGLRSSNRVMPEEINRILTDHASDLLFAPTLSAFRNLEREGLMVKSHLVGDVMLDLLLSLYDRITANSLNHLKLPKEFFVSTIHRAANTDSKLKLSKLIHNIAKLDYPVVLVAHPRLLSAARKFEIDLNQNNIKVLEPQDYLTMLSVLHKSSGVITDSGGLQKEAFLLGIPCRTLRTESEWPETFEDGMNTLDPEGENLRNLFSSQKRHSRSELFGNGSAAEKIVEIIAQSSY